MNTARPSRTVTVLEGRGGARRRRRRLLAVVTLACVVATAAGTTVAAAGTATPPVLSRVADLADVATYKVHTVLRNVDGTTTDTITPGVVAVPTLVDAHRAPVPVPDLSVTVVFVPTPSPRMRIDIARLTLAGLPVLVETVFDLPGGTRGAAFGYDGRADTAPSRFATTVTFDKGSASEVGLSMTSGGAGTTLGIIGALFTRAAGATRVDPTDVRVDLTPVPGSLTATARLDDGAGRVDVDLSTSAATVAALAVSDRRPGGELGATATIDALPSWLSLDLAGRPDTHHQQLQYKAAAPIALITSSLRHRQRGDQTLVDATVGGLPVEFGLLSDTPPGGVQSATWSAEGRLGFVGVDVRQLEGSTQTSQIVANASDVSPYVTFNKNGDRVEFGADSPIGSLEAGLASPGAVVLGTGEPADYLKVAGSSSAVRILGLKSFTAETADPVTLSAEVAPVALHADITRGDLHVDAVVDRLPSRLANLSFSAAQGVVEYHAADPIDRITVDATRSSGIVGRATRANLTLRGIPNDLSLDFGDKAPAGAITPRSTCEPTDDDPSCGQPGDPDGGGGGGGGGGGDGGGEVQFPDLSSEQRLLLDANGASVGSAELLLTNGPDAPTEPLTPAQDGVIVEDLADRFVVQARITGLRRAFVHQKTVDDRNIAVLGTLETDHTVELSVDPALNGGRAVVVDHRHQRGLAATAKVDRTRGFLTNLPETVLMTFGQYESLDPAFKLTTARYEAASAITRATLEADVPGLANPVFVAIDNVPTLATLCKATNHLCGEHDADDHGSFGFEATSPVRLSAFICLDHQPCTHDDPSAFTHGVVLRDVTLQELGFELHRGDLSEEDPLRMRFDTGNRPVTGNIVLLGGSAGTAVDINFPGPWFIDPKEPGGLQVTGVWAGPLQANDFRITFDKDIPIRAEIVNPPVIHPATCLMVRVPVVDEVPLLGCG